MIGKNQILINQMLNGDVDAIKIGLNSDNTALKINDMPEKLLRN